MRATYRGEQNIELKYRIQLVLRIKNYVMSSESIFIIYCGQLSNE